MSEDQVGWLEKPHQSADLSRLLAHAPGFYLYVAEG